MDKLVELVLQTYGIAGVLILSPVVALGIVWKNYLKQQKEHLDEIQGYHKQVAETQKLVADAQAARVADAYAYNNRLTELVRESSALGTATNMLLTQLTKDIDRLTN